MLPARIGRLLGKLVRLMAAGAGQTGPVPVVAPVRDGHAQRGADAHVVDVVAVVLAAGDGDEGGANKGYEADQGATKVACPRAEDSKLAGEEESREAQPGKGEGGVARGEGAPAFLEGVGVVVGGADGYVDRDVLGGVRGGNAAGEEVRTGTTDGVLDDVGEEGGQGDGDEEGEVCGLVLDDGGTQDNVDGDEDAKGDEESVDKVQPCVSEPGARGRLLDIGMVGRDVQTGTRSCSA